MDRKQHWESVYQTKRPTEVSWYQAEPTLSLSLVNEAAGAGAASVIDVGGGASTLVDRLVERPSTTITVLDLSGAALREAQRRVGEKAEKVNWIEADILNVELPKAAFDVWHDRAVFHFLTDAADRRRYVEQVSHSVRIGGHVLVATFAADGPQKCSGLEVARYSPDELHAQFGSAFRLIRSVHESHITPMGTTQKFVYCLCSVESASRTRRAA
ncbi:MAG: class I SAM-dependent methyltransferase [Vicinamibacteria bacterium]|nr:class I SAM-dependent methyltransferase [Vicinamibacteria bacterium]